MKKKIIVRRIIIWLVIFAVATTGYLGIQRMRAFSHLNKELMLIACQDIYTGTLVENIETFIEDGQPMNLAMAYNQAELLYNAWRTTSSACFWYAEAKQHYEHKKHLRYQDITIELDIQGEDNCITGGQDIMYGFLFLRNALQGYIKTGETPLKSQNVRDYLLGVCDQLRQLDEIQQKYDFTAFAPDSKEYVILHLAMYRELRTFSETFKLRLGYKPNEL